MSDYLHYTRRDVLRMGTALAAGMGLTGQPGRAVARGVERLASGQARVLWVQGMSCTGCSVSFLNADAPDALHVLTQMVSLVYHQTVSAAQGSIAQDVVNQLVDQGGYVLVVEGAVPADMPDACTIGGSPLVDQLPRMIEHADAVVAAGTCAAFGGIPAAQGNVTGAQNLRQFMEQAQLPLENRLVNCPGCPVHPQSLIGTLAYIAGKGYPDVDPDLLTPRMFFAHSVHDECPRFHYWEKKVFAEKFGDEGCLFKLGCLGPLSHTSCPRRQWNGGVNWCIRASAPCIGCCSADFAKNRDFPFYRKGEDLQVAAVTGPGGRIKLP